MCLNHLLIKQQRTHSSCQNPYLTKPLAVPSEARPSCHLFQEPRPSLHGFFVRYFRVVVEISLSNLNIMIYFRQAALKRKGLATAEKSRWRMMNCPKAQESNYIVGFKNKQFCFRQIYESEFVQTQALFNGVYSWLLHWRILLKYNHSKPVYWCFFNYYYYSEVLKCMRSGKR